jgi:dihydroorotase
MELLSANPRKIINQTASTADFIILNFDEEWMLPEKNIKSKSRNSPYLNTPLKGKVKAVFSKGNFIITNN